MFAAELLVTAKHWKCSKYPSVWEHLDKRKQHTAAKKNEGDPYVLL